MIPQHKGRDGSPFETARERYMKIERKRALVDLALALTVVAGMAWVVVWLA